MLFFRELGRQPEILSYECNRISIRKPDGVLIVGMASPFMAHLHSHAMLGKWMEARRICRYVNVSKMQKYNSQKIARFLSISE